MPIQNKPPVRPTNRERVYDVIDGERDYQDETIPELERSLTPGEYLFSLEEQIAKARAQWTSGRDGEIVTINNLRKLAGIAVRALEEHGAIPREYHVPASANITGEMRARDFTDELAPSRQADPRRGDF